MLRTFIHRRRAAMYLTVLMSAMLVTVIGLGGLMLARARFRIGQAGDRAMQARFYAQSAIDLGIQSIRNDANWRNNLTNNVWAPNQTVSLGTFRWKPVDELDGVLNNDANAEIRIYGTGVVGDTVRTYSVALEPQTNEPNLLRNPGLEDGTMGWRSWNCSLILNTTNPHSGASRVQLWKRATYDSTAYQDITGTIQNGESYYVEVWARTASNSENVTISLKTIGSSSGTRIFVTSAVSVNTAWTLVSGTLTPTWTGTLVEARWRVFSYPSGGSRDFYIDDAVMRVAPDPTKLAPVPGSWRREVSP